MRCKGLFIVFGVSLRGLYSHSIVPVGLGVSPSSTRLTPAT